MASAVAEPTQDPIMSEAMVYSAVDPLADLPFDQDLVQALTRQPIRYGPIQFHTPSFKHYDSSEIPTCGQSAWPAISVTGAHCKLACDHCKAKILEPMISATTPDALWRVVNEQIDRGARGMLLSGGSNHRNEVEYGPFFSTLRRIKQSFPEFKIAVHTALISQGDAQQLEAAGVDVAMLDIIGAQDTLTQVYHLRRRVADFERSLDDLSQTTLKLVPHIVLGLHYGRMLGEWQALDIVRRHRVDALVLVAAMPFYAPAQRPFVTPNAHAVGRFFLTARQALPNLPLLLGCARPPGQAKVLIDSYAVMAGLNGIAHPAEGVVELAVQLGRAVRVNPSCCSIGIDDGAMIEDVTNETEQTTVHEWIAQEQRQRTGLSGIPVVSA